MTTTAKLFHTDEGQGAPVLFLHGLAGDHGVFERQTLDISQGWRTLRVDARGHGQSEVPPGPWTIADFAGDFVGLLDELGLDSAHVVGHSAGGVFAMSMALDHPTRVKSLFLVGTSAELKPEIAEKSYLRWASLAQKSGLEAALEDARLPIPAGIRPEHGDGFAQSCRAVSQMVGEPLAPRLGEIRCPTAFVVGEKDPFGPGGSVKASRAVPGAELQIIEGQGHYPFRREVEDFNRRLRTFLEAVS
ncbi:MAG: alpha/beta hydrolase [Candidatus Binatia bacterium]|nr:alpha/beta hydrolase [Candidatus Binatia bacterium]